MRNPDFRSRHGTRTIQLQLASACLKAEIVAHLKHSMKTVLIAMKAEVQAEIVAHLKHSMKTVLIDQISGLQRDQRGSEVTPEVTLIMGLQAKFSKIQFHWYSH